MLQLVLNQSAIRFRENKNFISLAFIEKKDKPCKGLNSLKKKIK